MFYMYIACFRPLNVKNLGMRSQQTFILILNSERLNNDSWTDIRIKKNIQNSRGKLYHAFSPSTGLNFKISTVFFSFFLRGGGLKVTRFTFKHFDMVATSISTHLKIWFCSTRTKIQSADYKNSRLFERNFP